MIVIGPCAVVVEMVQKNDLPFGARVQGFLIQVLKLEAVCMTVHGEYAQEMTLPTLPNANYNDG